jgi:hypothetical protein
VTQLLPKSRPRRRSTAPNRCHHPGRINWQEPHREVADLDDGHPTPSTGKTASRHHITERGSGVGMANGDLDLCQADGHRQRTTHGTADAMNTGNVVANVWIWIPLRRDETVAGLCRLTARLADLDAADIETLVTEPPASRSPATSPATPRKRWPTSKPTPTACAMPTSAITACSSAPVPSKPAAKPSSTNASNSPACAGTSRRHRHPHPALPARQRPLGADLDTVAQPGPPPRDQARNKINNDHLQI